MSQARFRESCVLTGFFKHLRLEKGSVRTAATCRVRMAATCSVVSLCLLKHRSKSPGRGRDVARKFWVSVIPETCCDSSLELSC